MTPHGQNTPLQFRYPGFQSFKTKNPIHYRHRYCRIALVLDTLDERVCELAPVGSLLGNEEWLDCIYRRKIGAQWQTTCIGRPTAKDQKANFDRMLTRGQITALPGYENARMIWEKRNGHVTFPTRVAALKLTADGRPATLSEMLRAIQEAAGSADELLALIADGTLQIDVCGELSLLTAVRGRSAASSSGPEQNCPAGCRDLSARMVFTS